MTSPIERMIDKACGVTPESIFPETILLRCPNCMREKRAAREKTDPNGTAVVVTQCPKCVGGDFSSTQYFDSHGTEIVFTQETDPSTKEG